MADNKKVESSKAEAKSDEKTPEKTTSKAPDKASTTKDPDSTETPPQAAPAGASRTPVDQPSESVKPPTVDEVKMGAEIKSVAGTAKPSDPDPKDTLADHVDRVAKSAEALNASNKAVAEAEPFKKPEVKTVRAPTAEERLAQNVEAVAKSAEAYNESVAGEAASTPEDIRKRETAAISASKEQSRLAPLTGELRPDPEDDSYVTPGKVLAPKDPTSGDVAPEIERAPLVIAPLTGEVKPADEMSYPTPGHTRDPSMAMAVLDKHRDKFMLEGSEKTPFGVAPGQQASLLAANEEAWRNDAARLEDQKTRALDIAQAITAGDGLRRTRRAQKNLR